MTDCFCRKHLFKYRICYDDFLDCWEYRLYQLFFSHCISQDLLTICTVNDNLIDVCCLQEFNYPSDSSSHRPAVNSLYEYLTSIRMYRNGHCNICSVLPILDPDVEVS